MLSTISLALILLQASLFVFCEECTCVSTRYYCPATYREKKTCVDQSRIDSVTGLPECRYIWENKAEVMSIALNFDNCYTTSPCKEQNDTSTCLCKDSDETQNGVTAKSMTMCHFYYRDLTKPYIDCMCAAFKTEQREKLANFESIQNIILIVLIVLIITMISLACIISCYTMSRRPPRVREY